jgi:hypothetical protein
LPKFSDVGATDTPSVPPLPDNATENASPLMKKLLVPDAGPNAVGVNVYVNAHVPPAGSVTPWQVCPVPVNGPDGTPPAPDNGPNGKPVTFVRVVVNVGEVNPTPTVPKFSDVGAAVSPETPVPDNATENASPLIKKLLVPDAGPNAVGVNVYVNAHVPPAGSVTPWQVCPVPVNGPDGTPPAPDNGPNGAPVRFVRVVVSVPEVAPSATLPKFSDVGATDTPSACATFGAHAAINPIARAAAPNKVKNRPVSPPLKSQRLVSRETSMVPLGRWRSADDDSWMCAP